MHDITVSCPDIDKFNNNQEFFLFRKMTGREELGQPFAYEVDLLSETKILELEKPAGDNIELKDILGAALTINVVIDVSNNENRYFNGHITEFQFTGMEQDYYSYRVMLRPRVWFLSQGVDNRIFQHATVEEVIEKTFKEFGLSSGGVDYNDQLDNQNLEYREYTVQYRESALAFVNRIMEREGIYYFFTQESDSHTLYLVNTKAAHNPAADDSADPRAALQLDFVPHYSPQVKERRNKPHIYELNASSQIIPIKYNAVDYDYKNSANLQTSDQDIDDSGIGRAQSATGTYKFEVRDYPGKFETYHDDLANFKSADKVTAVQTYSNNLTETRKKQLETKLERLNGKSNNIMMAAGAKLKTNLYPEGDTDDAQAAAKEYLVTSVDHTLEYRRYRTDVSDAARGKGAIGTGEPTATLTYHCDFGAIDNIREFRSERITPKPIVYGPQTATVVNASGEYSVTEDEIHTDDSGRVKVAFHWSRDYSGSEESDIQKSHTCYLRVSQLWAGNGWGAMHIPHVGQEVIVEFLEGDPDRPIITGRVYNDKNQPPLDLPNEKEASIIKDSHGNKLLMNDAGLGLYSPIGVSGIQFDDGGYKLLTDGDDNRGKFGNTFEYGIGTATELFGGVVTEFKGGLLSSFTAGLDLAFKLGGETTVNLTHEHSYQNGQIHKYSSEDVLSLSKDDQIIGAGDGLCLIGGAKDGKDHRSIVNLFDKSISLSVGGKKVQTILKPARLPTQTQGKYEGQVFDKFVPSVKEWRSWVYLLSFLCALVIGTLAAISHWTTSTKSTTASLIFTISATVLGGIIGAIAVVVGIVLFALEKSGKQTVEPLEHQEPPAAKLEMDHEGKISVQSKANEILIEVGSEDDPKGKIQIDSDGNINLSSYTGEIKLTADNEKITFNNFVVNDQSGEVSIKSYKLKGKNIEEV